MPGERYLPACVVPTVTFRGVDIGAWWCFSWNIVGPLVILHGNINSEKYKDILASCILSMVENQFGGDDCLYQHGSAPCHKSRSLREWFVDNNVKVSNFSGHYLRNRSTLDIGVLGYIGIF
jgi:hypothetical protein